MCIFVVSSYNSDRTFLVSIEHVDEDMLVPCALSLKKLLDTFTFPNNPTPYR